MSTMLLSSAGLAGFAREVDSMEVATCMKQADPISEEGLSLLVACGACLPKNVDASMRQM